MTWEDSLKLKLERRKADGLLRELPGENPVLHDFASNDYLGLTNISLKHSGSPYRGATGSRLLTGDSKAYHELEDFLAEHFNGESALVFNSGYQANLSLLSAIPQRSDTIIIDEFSHASIKDGVRLSTAKHFSFLHNDMRDLERKLQKSEGQKFVVAEALYSMDGDYAPMETLLNLCSKYDAALILDEAHSGGICGPDGKGLSFEYAGHPALLGRIYTFGKAWAAHGAAFIGKKLIKDFLINFARPFIYTTALPLHSLLHIREAIHYQVRHPELLFQLEDNIHYFREELENSSLRVINSLSPIQPVLINGNQRVRAIASQIKYYGFDVRPILSPTVKIGSERFRICLHSFNTSKQIFQLIRLLEELQ